MQVQHPGGNLFTITDEQFETGMKAARLAKGHHYPVWSALKTAGVPVRDAEGKTFATLVATAVTETFLTRRSR